MVREMSFVEFQDAHLGYQKLNSFSNVSMVTLPLCLQPNFSSIRHMVNRLGDVVWRISNGGHIGYPNITILAILHVAQMSPTKFWSNLINKEMFQEFQDDCHGFRVGVLVL